MAVEDNYGLETLSHDSPSLSDAPLLDSIVPEIDTNIDAVHIIAHGDVGELFLGNAAINNQNLAEYEDLLATWDDSLAENADLLLYGCNTGAGVEGENFIAEFGHLTQADVAASNNLTGATKLGGDWVLEVDFGDIEAQSVFSEEIALTYQDVLFDGFTGGTINLDLSTGFLGNSPFNISNPDFFGGIDYVFNPNLVIPTTNFANFTPDIWSIFNFDNPSGLTTTNIVNLSLSAFKGEDFSFNTFNGNTTFGEFSTLFVENADLFSYKPELNPESGLSLEEFNSFSSSDFKALDYAFAGDNLFDADYYLANNPDVAASGENPFTNFMESGVNENKSPNALWPKDGYIVVSTKLSPEIFADPQDPNNPNNLIASTIIEWTLPSTSYPPNQISPSHRQIINEANQLLPFANTKEWRNIDGLNYFRLLKTDKKGAQDFVDNFKNQWVNGYKDIITQAANQFNIPQDLLAAVAWREVGGDPPAFDLVEDARSLGLYPGHPDETSFGNLSIQLRRAASALGYDPNQLSSHERTQIRNSLLNSNQNLFIAAKHLSDLRDKYVGNQYLCQFGIFLTINIQKIFNFLMMYLFLFNIKAGLYPYSDIDDSFYPYVISSKALVFKLCCSLLGLILSFISINICLCVLKKGIKKSILRYILIFLLLLSSLEITFLISRFLELKYITSLVNNCDLHHKVEIGCSISPDKF